MSDLVRRSLSSLFWMTTSIVRQAFIQMVQIVFQVGFVFPIILKRDIQFTHELFIFYLIGFEKEA